MSSEVKLSTRHALRVLRPGPFRRYIIGSAISDTGTWMQVMAQGYVMSTLTDKALLLGLANLAAGLPMLLLTMAGGSAADRFDKRKILLATQYAQIALAISIGFLIMSGKIQIWHILAFAGVLGISNSFEMPTLNALVPESVARGNFYQRVGSGFSLFFQRTFVRGTDHRPVNDPAATAWHRRGGTQTRQWNQGRFSVRRER